MEHNTIHVELLEQALHITYLLRTGEVEHAYHLYSHFISTLNKELNHEELVSNIEIFKEMLRAQETNNTIWLSDIIEFILLPKIKENLVCST